jgi:hypothetical protein
MEMLKATNTDLTYYLCGPYGYLYHIGGEQKLFRDMLRNLFDYGILITINSDNSACHSNVEDNLVLVAEQCQFTDADIVKLE